MDRREFARTTLATGLVTGLASSLAAAAGGQSARALDTSSTQPEQPRRSPFKLKYAPHFGMFRHHAGDDLLEQLRFMRDNGFTALEDNGMAGRSTEVQEQLARELQRLDMTMGVFVVNMQTAWQPTLSTGAAEPREKFLAECRKAVEVAQRVNATWMTVVPGTLEPRLDLDYQTAHVVESLRRAAEIFEPNGLVMVLEPLNHRRDHPGLFLTRIAHAHLVCRAVNSPACKVLFDIYHQQITEGNLIPNLELAWNEVAYIQVGDNPGRAEPTTGEINYRTIFRWLHNRSYTGIVGMEHGRSRPGREGEQAVIDAYRWCDDF